ncbi:MAG: tRNA (N(6)-L-threonylcarbamoyladenosine(37)-C(2))-methylthiotransferase MtaB [Bacilli bacterium]
MKFAIYTLGCKVNTYESEYVIKQLELAGYEMVDFNDKADIYIINTCTVTNTSDQKSRKMIRHAKKQNDQAIIIAMGCHTQLVENDENILKIADIVIGNTNKNNLVSLINEFYENHQKILRVENIMNAGFEDMEIGDFKTRTRALVKIEDGCENYCTYCIIPYVRGKVRSKKPERVINEVSNLVKKGYREIVLTGIHTGHYGSDLINYDFSDLLVALEEIKGLERIRISSIEITELNDKFLEILKVSKKIVNHIHIPLQSGCDKILKLMNRKYDSAYFYEKISKIRKIRPLMAITTDVIVGFPGESQEDYEITKSFIENIAFAGGHVFPYSIRKNTKAAIMEGQVLKEIKHQRSKDLIMVFKKLEHNYYKKYLEKEVIVIPESFNNGVLTGHTENYLKVSFNGLKTEIGNNVIIKTIKLENNELFGIKK